MSEKFRLDCKIGFQNTFYTKCINVLIDSIGRSIILRSIFNSFPFPYTFCTVALKRIQPARNPREGVLQYRKKEISAGIKLVKTNDSENEKLRKIIAKHNFNRPVKFTVGLSAIQVNKTKLLLNKPIYVGFSVLDISKYMMNDWYYKN